MTESIGTARLDIVVETSGMTAGVNATKNEIRGLSADAQKQFDAMTKAQQRSALSFVTTAQNAGKTREEVRALSAEMKIGGALGKQLADNLRAAGKAGNFKAATAEMSKYGLSAKQTAFALRGVPAQVTDIVTALASGQRPFTVLIQQGGQLKDMFGGVVPAARALGGALLGLINPYTLAAAAAAAFGLALKSAAEESDSLNRAIILSGNFARTSADGLRDIGKSAAEATASTVSNATEVAAKVVATGRFTAEQVEKVTQAALNMQRVAGIAIDDTIGKFVQLADAPVRAIETLNKSQNAFAKQTQEQVKAFDDQGKAADAAGLAIDDYANTLNSRSRQIEANLSGWTLLWKDVGLGASSAFDEIKRGLTETDASLKATASNTASLASAFNGMFTLALGAFAKLEQARSSAAKTVGSFANVIGSTDSVSADFARTRGLPENFGLNVAPPEKAAAGGGGGRVRSGGGSRAVRAAPDFRGQDEAARLKAIADEERATEAFKDMAAMLSGPLAQAEREHEKNQARLRELAKDSPAAAAGLTDALAKEAAQYAQTTAEIQKQLDPIGQILEAQRLELDMIGKSNAEREVMNALLAKGTDLRSQEAQAALAQARANQAEAESRQQSIDLMDDFRQGAANALTDFVTGAKSAKDALKDFFDELAQQITQAIANQWIKQLFGQQGSDGSGTSGGGWLNAIMGLFGSGGGEQWYANGGAFSNGVQKFATGGVFDKPTMFGMAGGRMGVMGEAGPEAILPLHRGPDGKLGVRAAANDESHSRPLGPAVVNQTLVLQGRPDSRTPAQYEQAAARAQNRVTSRNR